MTNINDMSGMVAALEQYNKIYNSPGMIAARELANSPAARAAQELANNPAVQVAQQLSNSPAVQLVNNQGYRGAIELVASIQSVLDAVRPVYMDVPLYNVSALNAMAESAQAAVNMQNTLTSIQRGLPDMSVLNSISQTVASLAPVFESVHDAVEAMRPLWDGRIIHVVNPDAVMEYMIHDESLASQIVDEDIKSLHEEVSEVINSEDPTTSIQKLFNKDGKARKIALGVIYFIATTIVGGKIQYEMQPMYQTTPHVMEIQQDQECEMSEGQVEFSVFCIENVAANLGLSGDETYQLLTGDHNILDEYIIPNYEILHTQSKEYIVNDIIDYMKECGVLK